LNYLAAVLNALPNTNLSNATQGERKPL